MQIFRVGSLENQSDEEVEKHNSQKNKFKLSIIQKRLDQNEDCSNEHISECSDVDPGDKIGEIVAACLEGVDSGLLVFIA